MSVSISLSACLRGIILVPAMVLAPLYSFANSEKSDDPVVATIQGEPVSTREFRLIMVGKASDVFAHFKREKDLDDYVGYWKDDGTQDCPIVYLRKVTLEELKRIKTEQAMAKKKGLIQDASYGAFQSELNGENERRARAVEEKTVIYGPRQYGEAAFYYVRFDNMAHQLREDLAKEVSVPDEEVRKKYEELRPQLGETSYEDVKDRIAEKLRLEAADAKIRAEIESATVETDEKAIALMTPRSEP